MGRPVSVLAIAKPPSAVRLELAGVVPYVLLKENIGPSAGLVVASSVPSPLSAIVTVNVLPLWAAASFATPATEPVSVTL